LGKPRNTGNIGGSEYYRPETGSWRAGTTRVLVVLLVGIALLFAPELLMTYHLIVGVFLVAVGVTLTN